jgi:type IV pilus assembly protein PilQ
MIDVKIKTTMMRKVALLIALLIFLVLLSARVYAAKEAGPVVTGSLLKPAELNAIIVDKTAYFTNLHIKVKGEIKDYTSFKVTDPFSVIVDLWGVKNLIEKDTIQVDTPQVKSIKVGQQKDKVRILIQTTRDQAMPYMVMRENGDIVVSIGGGEQEKVTSLERGVKGNGPSPEILGIDLEDFPELSNLVVTYSKKPSYEKKSGKNRVTLHFKDVKIADNLLHHLDARKFAIPIKLVDAKKVKGGVDVIISFEGGSPYSVNEKKGMIIVSFKKTKKMEKGYRIAEYKAVHKRERGKKAPGKRGEKKIKSAVTPPPYASLYSVQKKRYTGRRISLDFKDADIQNVLRIIAEVSKLNIVTSDEVKGKITIRLVNVPWDQALDIVLETKALGAKLEGNILRIAPLAKLRTEEREKLQSIKSREDLEELVIETISVNFADVKELERQVQEVMSDRGKVKVDERTNTLIIKDTAKGVEKVRRLVRKLDTQTPQVLIEARIVEVSTNFNRELGVQWGAAYQDNTHGIFVSGLMDDQGTLFAGVQKPDPSSPTFSVNLPAAVGKGSGGGLSFGIIKTNFRLDLALSALEMTGNGKIISSPKIVTINNNKASIQQGVKIPYSTVSASGTQTQFVDATLKLEVTPTITPDNTIIMQLDATNDTPDFGSAVNGVPSISSREAITQVLVKDGETAVIGGILQIKRSESVDAVPWAHRIPILGWFFKKESVQNDNTELLIFITPKIVKQGNQI